MFNSDITNKLINAKIIFINNNIQYQASLLAVDYKNRYYCLTATNNSQFTVTEVSENTAKTILNERFNL